MHGGTPVSCSRLYDLRDTCGIDPAWRNFSGHGTTATAAGGGCSAAGVDEGAVQAPRQATQDVGPESNTMSFSRSQGLVRHPPCACLLTDCLVCGACSKQVQFGIMSSAEIIKNGTLQTFETKLYKVNAFLQSDCMCMVQETTGFCVKHTQQTARGTTLQMPERLPHENGVLDPRLVGASC